MRRIFYSPAFIKIVTIFIGVAVIWLLIKTIQKYLISKIKNNDSLYRSKKFSSFIGYFFTIVLFSVVFKNKLGELSVAMGIAGAGIAFALQEVIVSFAGWLAILFGGFYKPGDRIQLGGIKGDVMDIGVLRTTIMEIGQWIEGDLYNGRIVFISNSFVFKEPVFNYSRDFPFLWDEIKVPIQYGSDYAHARQILMDIGVEIAEEFSRESQGNWQTLERKYRLEDTPTEPMVSIAINDKWVELTLRYIVVYNKRRITRSELFSRILKEFEATHGEIKFASATFSFGGVLPV